ncbi:MAG TPA: sugar phosphate nucleotidyltransferase [Candidatus Paceibacterota bacterium]
MSKKFQKITLFIIIASNEYGDRIITTSKLINNTKYTTVWILYVKLFGSGEEFSVNLYYTIQVEPVGIAHGLGLAKSFSDGKKIALILGDNVFGDDLSGAVKKFSKKEKGGLVVLKKVSDPERFIEFLMSLKILSRPLEALHQANILIRKHK